MQTSLHQRVAAAARCLVLAACLAAGAPARAALGDDAASVRADAASLGVTARPSDYPSYRVERATAPSGLEIREYLGADGRVFAVGWSGPIQPDFQKLLGTHYPDYAAALAALHGPGLRRSLRLSLPGAIVESSGHLRAYSGRAYLPDRVPSGMALAVLR